MAAFARRLAVFPAALLLAQPARAQQEVRVGNFELTLETDPATGQGRRTALLYPRDVERGGWGAVLWTCAGPTGELMINLKLDPPPGDGERRPVFWRFSPGGMDTSWVEPMAGEPGWFLRQADAAPFTIAATTASQLMIRTPGHAFPEGAPDYFTYDLPGAAAALGRLPCVRASLGSGADTVAGDATYELSAVEELPRPTNTAEFRQALDRGYPRLLRDARVNGTVEVRMRVLPDGRVDPASIHVSSSTHEAFDEPTIRAVRMLRFRPAKVRGQPVPVWIHLPVQWIPS
ncbi:MAG TPA: energy transducer TonB [Longimicrobium sp.]